MVSPDPDVEAILDTLSRHEVRYLIIGGIAAVLFGSPYPTEDLDICADEKGPNRHRLSQALIELDAREWDPHKGEFVEREWTDDMLAVDRTWLLQTRFGRLDILFAPAGTGGYPDLARRRQMIRLGDREVPVSAIEDLIRMKEAAGRERDRLHVPTLRKMLEEWRHHQSEGH